MNAPILLTVMLCFSNLIHAHSNHQGIDFSNQLPEDSVYSVYNWECENEIGSIQQSTMERMVQGNALIDFEIQRPFYNHSFKLTSGASLKTVRMNNSMANYNDTSEHQFTVNGHSPIFSFTHEMAVDSTFGFSYTLGYSNSNILFDNEYYGTREFFISVNPHVFISRSYNFETFCRLKIGVSYSDNRLSENPSEMLKRIYVTGFQMFTGVAFGVNYLFSDQLALSAELSLWSPETLNLGISYRLFDLRKRNAPDFMRLAY